MDDRVVVCTRGEALVSGSSQTTRLLALQHAAYRIEADLIQDERIPPLHECEAELLGAGLGWLVALDADDGLVGALGFRTLGSEVDIDRLIVDPTRHRHGIGRRLVVHALTLGDSAVVSTGRDNAPARALYESLGFSHQRDREDIPRLWVSDYRWRRAAGTPSA